MFEIQEKIRENRKNHKIPQPDGTELTPISLSYVNFIEFINSLVLTKLDNEITQIIHDNANVIFKIIEISSDYSNSTIFINKISNLVENIFHHDNNKIILKKLIDNGIYEILISKIDFESLLDIEKYIELNKKNFVE